MAWAIKSSLGFYYTPHTEAGWVKDRKHAFVFTDRENAKDIRRELKCKTTRLVRLKPKAPPSGWVVFDRKIGYVAVDRNDPSFPYVISSDPYVFLTKTDAEAAKLAYDHKTMTSK